MRETIPARTMKRICIYFNNSVNIEGIELEDIARETVYPAPKNKNSLLKPKDIQALQDVIVCRDNSNNVMSRDEAITIVSQLSQCFNSRKYEKHWNYLIANKEMSNIKAGRKVKKAKNTTIKRTEIYVEQ